MGIWPWQRRLHPKGRLTPSLARETRPASPYSLGVLRLFHSIHDTLRFGKNVHRSIHVPVVIHPAFRAGPLTDTEVFGARPHMPADGTGLGRRVVPSNPDDPGPVLSGTPPQDFHKRKQSVHALYSEFKPWCCSRSNLCSSICSGWAQKQVASYPKVG